jgi:TerC family integral membrane protein
MLALDLGIVNRRAHVVSTREALAFTVVLAILALMFNGLVWYVYDHQWLTLGTHVDRLDGVQNTGRLAAIKFFTGYLIELSLSADNVFVMAVIFSQLRIPAQYQHRVLFWGILGALVMRGAMILLGTSLISRYHWILYAFGAFLVFTAIRMFFAKEDSAIQQDEVFIIRLLRRVAPVTSEFSGAGFTARIDGRRFLTPLAVALVLVETMDLVFALDSIPATFAITADPFLVFTSNVFAILGLRSLYFALAGAMQRFRYLKVSLALILGLVGLKMLVSDLLTAQVGSAANLYVLGVVAAILAGGVFASMLEARGQR